jgi:type IV pilus assembly protein PilX
MRVMRQSLRGQRGLVLVSSLLLLVVVTIMAISMFRSYGIQGKIAGNVREKHRALEEAQTALQAAENWLASTASTSTLPTPVNCTGNSPALSANLNQFQICASTSDLLTVTGFSSVATVPWTDKNNTATTVGIVYTPTGSASNQFTPAANNPGAYFDKPRFYITDLGQVAGFVGGAGSQPPEVYRIDAVGYGGSADAVAVIEETFQVKFGQTNAL